VNTRGLYNIIGICNSFVSCAAHNLELFGKLLSLAMKEGSKDPAILRELMIALVNSVTLKKLAEENEKEKTKELLKFAIAQATSKCLELQVTAIIAIQKLVLTYGVL
jgi:hypothetical protein